MTRRAPPSVLARSLWMALALVLAHGTVATGRAVAHGPGPDPAGPGDSSGTCAPEAQRETDPLLLRYERVKRAGWWMTGLSLAGIALTGGLLMATCSCTEDDFLCLCSSGAFTFGIASLMWSPGLAAGIITGSIGTYKLNHHSGREVEVGFAGNRVQIAVKF